MGGLVLDDKEVALGAGDTPIIQLASTQPQPPPRRDGQHARVSLEGGRKYKLRVEYRQPGAGGVLQLRWLPPATPTLSEAEALVRDSDVAIVCVGLSSELEGEEMRGVNIPGFLGGDRTSLDLPEPQERLVKAAIATGKPVVVVLTSGSASAASSAAKGAAALLQAWYGG
jgi:beta-glucosidase